MLSLRTRHPRKTDFCRGSRVRVKIYGSVSNEAPVEYRQKDAFAGCIRARPSVRRAQPIDTPRITQKALKARVCGARIFLSLCKRFVRVDFDIFNLYFNVIISNYITFARQTLTQLKLTVRYPDISSKSKGHRFWCPLLLELTISREFFRDRAKRRERAFVAVPHILCYIRINLIKISS